MRHPWHAPLRLAAICLALTLTGLAAPPPADAQIWKKVKEKVKDAAEEESMQQVDRVVREQVQCLFNDPQCIREAEESGQDVILTGPDGAPIVDEEGAPVTDPDEAARIMGAGMEAEGDAATPRPGEGVWANYDFVPGEEVLFYEDYSNDNVGDFPRRLEFVRGNWDVVEWNGQTLLRNTGPRHSALKIPLPEALPEKFTIEIPVVLYEGNANLALATSVPEHPSDLRVHHYTHNYFDIGSWGTGLVSMVPTHPTSTQDVREALTAGLVPIRIMADGAHVKVYVGERRVANVPNADLKRANTLWLENTYFASEEQPILIGPIRVASGGRDLYDALAEEGRVSTYGILFATNSDAILPESTPTLKEIGTMLEEHPELRLRIEGHTDSDGEEAYNQDLSERRAASVKRFLVESYGLDDVRLETAGFGESQPVAGNDTPEGKQQNRRVELVKLDAEAAGG